MALGRLLLERPALRVRVFGARGRALRRDSLQRSRALAAAPGLAAAQRALAALLRLRNGLSLRSRCCAALLCHVTPGAGADRAICAGDSRTTCQPATFKRLGIPVFDGFLGGMGSAMYLTEANSTQTEDSMFSWALLFLILALVAALFGFGGIASAAAGVAKIIFLVALVAFLISLIAPAFKRGP